VAKNQVKILIISGLIEKRLEGEDENIPLFPVRIELSS